MGDADPDFQETGIIGCSDRFNSESSHILIGWMVIGDWCPAAAGGNWALPSQPCQTQVLILNSFNSLN